MPAIKYIVDLTNEEREQLRGLIRKGKASTRKLTRARILLKADEGLTDQQVGQCPEHRHCHCRAGA
jgi:hypothetical protein